MIQEESVHVMRECSQHSFENMPFPEVLAKLAKAGVESYHADLFRHEKTYYMPNGDSHAVQDEKVYAAQLSADMVTPELDSQAVQAVVGQIQKRQIGYLEFLQRIMKAGVSSYNVYLRGRRAVYVGRTGDEHIEWFPGAK